MEKDGCRLLLYVIKVVTTECKKHKHATMAFFVTAGYYVSFSSLAYLHKNVSHDERIQKEEHKSFGRLFQCVWLAFPNN